jgi:hypothetical protein
MLIYNQFLHSFSSNKFINNVIKPNEYYNLPYKD